MRFLLSILLVTLCPIISQAQGNLFSDNKRLLEKSREMFAKEDYDSALFYINKAEVTKGKLQQEPELAAAIHEQYCLIFSALDNKQQSDYHRNMYLDVLEHSRQDINLERHADDLHKRMRLLMFKTVLLAVVALAFIVAFFYLRKLFTKDKEGNKILKKKDYREQNEQFVEQIAVLRHQLFTEKKQGAEKRAKVALLQNVSPLIARLRHALEVESNTTRPLTNENTEFIKALLDEIEVHNALLTDWIRLEQGRLALRIETFNLREIQEILRKNTQSFALQGITMNVSLPDIKVKADKVLTLFMLNTLADNARKATLEGGTIEITATPVVAEPVAFVELSVTDTGKGMSEEEAAVIFSRTTPTLRGGRAEGFGLLNCRGIINSYKKAGSLFNCCMIGVQSKIGEGSRFFFRLPIVRLLLLLFAFQTSPLALSARPTRYTETIADSLLRQAANYADSAYYSNLDGNYRQTIMYADSAQMCLMQTFSDSLLIDDITVDVSNEAAVAALALHRWEDYRTYNNTYENAFHRLTDNDELVVYCREKEAYLENIKVTWRVINLFALFALVLLVVGLVLRFVHKRRMLKYQKLLELDDKQAEIERLTYETEGLHIANNILANGLSTIKHETMYYPSRIKTLLNGDIENALEMAVFYEQLHNSLLQQITSQKLATGVHSNDPELLEYLTSLVKKYDGKTLNSEDCFTPKRVNIPLLIARQIMRDLSSSTSRGSGIVIEDGKIVLKFFRQSPLNPSSLSPLTPSP